MKNVILLAPPAAGKGTLAKTLCEKYGYVSISTGDLLREKAQEDKELSAMLKTGKLVSDELVFDVLKAKLNKLGNTPYILDGFPRTINQAVMYDEMISDIGKDLGVVIYLDIDKEILKQRVTTRLTCPNCKSTFSTVNEGFIPKKEGICDKCNSKLVQREDDTEEAFEKRYEEFLAKTAPLVDYYGKTGSLNRIADTDFEVIFSKVSAVVNNND